MSVLSEEAFANALRLRDDATLLRSAGRDQTALALLILSIEEIVSAYVLRWIEEGRIPQSNLKKLNNHVPKHHIFVGFIELFMTADLTSSSLPHIEDFENLSPEDAQTAVNEFWKCARTAEQKAELYKRQFVSTRKLDQIKQSCFYANCRINGFDYKGAAEFYWLVCSWLCNTKPRAGRFLFEFVMTRNTLDPYRG